MAAVLSGLDGVTAWSEPDRYRWLSRNQTAAGKRSEATARRLTVARCSRRGLTRMLARHLPAPFTYLNVGHSNLSKRVLGAVKQVPESTIAVLVHDTIPFDHPDLHQPKTVAAFREKLKQVKQFADIIICNSVDTELRVQAALRGGSKTIVSHLGIDAIAAGAVGRPAEQSPYFVTVGTIDLRKNQGLLLDVWDALPKDAKPHLYIVGSRGWGDAELFRRLDAAKAHGSNVTEINGLSDQETTALIAGSLGVLHPSRAEGYGFTLIEAALLGVPIIASDLPVYRETVGEMPVYLSPDDMYQWLQSTQALSKSGPEIHKNLQQGADVQFPTWANHIDTVLNSLN
jgi:glycosyltransferase involved in cell wall biosynthesis